MRSAMRSRRQGHWPMVVRLRSSTSTMTTRPLRGLLLMDRSSMSYAALSDRPSSAGVKTASTAATITAPTPHRNTSRHRGGRALRKLATAVRLPHSDVDAPIAGLRGFIGSLDQGIELTNRGDFDAGITESGRDENTADRHCPLQPEPVVRLLGSHRVGVSDDDDVLDDVLFHGCQDLWDERLRFIRQLVRLESEKQREASWCRWQCRQGVAEHSVEVGVADLGGNGRAARNRQCRLTLLVEVDGPERVRDSGGAGPVGIRVRQQDDQVLARTLWGLDALRPAR